MSSQQNTIDLDELKAFLLNANMPHATGTATTTKEADGSRTIEFNDGEYRMHDNFFGGEPYGGRLVVFYENKPLFIEVYYGQTSKPAEEVYTFLREALQHPDPQNPYRGPAEYTKNSLTYKSVTKGTVANHTVEEFIFDSGKEIYSAVIIGGLVDQHAQGAM